MQCNLHSYGEMLLLQRSCKTSGNNTEVEGFTIVYRGERERAVSFFHLRKWMCECFTLHLLGLHRFVTTLCTCVTPLVPEEWIRLHHVCDLPVGFLISSADCCNFQCHSFTSAGPWQWFFLLCFFLQEDPMQPFSCYIATSLAHA